MIKNIVIVSDSGVVNGGNAKVAIDSAIALKKKGYNVIFFCGTKKFEKKLIVAGVDVISTEQNDILSDENRIRAIFNGIYNGVAKKKFEKVIKQLDKKNTIVHIHSWSKILSCSIFDVTKKYDMKLFITMHDYFSCCPNGGLFNYPQNCICHKKPMSFSCVFCNCDSRRFIYKIWRVIRQVRQEASIKGNDITFITISDLNDKICKKYNSKKGSSIRITNPVELNDEINIVANDNKEYVYIGRLSEEKGIEYFCEAVKNSKVHGTIIGDGKMYNELSYKYPDITFTGWLDRKEMQQHLKKTRCLVFPSVWYEGAPLTILEMLSCGIPCVVSDASSARELIIDGKNEYIFKSGSIRDLGRCINEMEKDISHMTEYINKNFDMEKYRMESHILNLEKAYNGVR